MPILEKVTTPVTTYAKENPRRTFALYDHDRNHKHDNPGLIHRCF